MARTQHLPRYQSIFVYTKELYRLRVSFRKSVKHDLGQEVCESAIKLLKCVVLANAAVKKDPFLSRLVLESEKKLESALPELKRAVEPSTKTAKAILPVRYFSKKINRSQFIEIVDRRLTPWGPPKKRLDVNKPEVYRWLDKVCPVV